MHAIGELIDRNIVLRGADRLSSKGFTQVPNHVLESSVLSPGAKLCYAMLLKYAWQNDYCFPGQKRLAADMGVTERSVRTYLHELRAKQLVRIRRRGLGRPNLYELDLRVTRVPARTGKKFRSGSDKELRFEWEKNAVLNGKESDLHERNQFPPNNMQLNNI